MIDLSLGKGTDSPVQLKAGTVIFAEGEAAKYLVIIKKGQVRLLKRNGQHLKVFKICEEKEILNEVSVLTNKVSSYSAIAKTDVELVFIEQKDILAVVNNGPSWIPEIFETLCERLVSTLGIIDEHNLMAGEKSSDMILSKEEEVKYSAAISGHRIKD